MRRASLSEPMQSCKNTRGGVVTFPGMSTSDTKLIDSSVVRFVPRTLSLQHNHVYTFEMHVQVQGGTKGCHRSMRVASATASVMIAQKGQDTLPVLKIAACSKYPCECKGGSNDEGKFNPGAKVVLRACSSAPAEAHDWVAISSPPITGATFVSPTGYGTSIQTSVTVILSSVKTQNVLEP